MYIPLEFSDNKKMRASDLCRKRLGRGREKETRESDQAGSNVLKKKTSVTDAFNSNNNSDR